LIPAQAEVRVISNRIESKVVVSTGAIMDSAKLSTVDPNSSAAA